MHLLKLMDMIQFIQMIMVHQCIEFPNEDVDDSGEQDDDDGMNDPPADQPSGGEPAETLPADGIGYIPVVRGHREGFSDCAECH